MATTQNKTSSTDLRVIKTRRSIRHAFEELLKQTEYSQITVSAIARKAEINRNTFYAHYGSIDDLLNELCRNKIEEAWGEAVANVNSTTGEAIFTGEDAVRDMKELTVSLIKALDENFEIESNLLRSIGLIKMVDMLIDPFHDFVTAEIERHKRVAESSIRCFVACYVGGLITAYVDWHRRAPHESIDELANQVALAFRETTKILLDD